MAQLDYETPTNKTSVARIWCRRVVWFHIAAICFAIVLFHLGIIQTQPPFDDVFVPYFFTSGPICFITAGMLGGRTFPWLTKFLPYRAASLFSIIYIPGLINAVLGSLQWYWIARLFCKMFIRQKTLGIDPAQ